MARLADEAGRRRVHGLSLGTGVHSIPGGIKYGTGQHECINRLLHVYILGSMEQLGGKTGNIRIGESRKGLLLCKVKLFVGGLGAQALTRFLKLVSGRERRDDTGTFILQGETRMQLMNKNKTKIKIKRRDKRLVSNVVVDDTIITPEKQYLS
jgi:hypothetical protein